MASDDALIEGVFLALLGLVLLISTVWSWRGRSRAARWWVRSNMGRGFVLGLMPGGGVCTATLGFVDLFAIDIDTVPEPLATVTALIPLLGLFVAVLGGFNLLPRFLEPDWYRPALKEEEARWAGPSEASTALGSMPTDDGTDPPAVSTDALSDLLPAGSPRRPTHRWGANWVYDPDTLERDHGAAPRGAVPGRLELRPDSVGFAALALEDRIRGEAIAWAVTFDELTTARLVPPRAGLDGIPRRGVLHRSLWKRLVLETDDRAYLVDVRRPKKVLGQIERLRNDVTR